MNIHTRLVGAIDSIILSLTAAVTIVMMLSLLNVSLDPSDMLGRRGTVTIQQLAMDDTATVRHM